MAKKIKNVKFTPKRTMTIIEAEKYWFNNPNPSDTDFEIKTNALTADERNELKEAAFRLHDSRQFIQNIKEQRPILPEYIREGYIGKLCYDMNGTEYLQTSRGMPYGSMVSIYNKERNKVYIGYSFLDEEEMFPHRLIGQAFALKKALENEMDDIDIEQIINKQFNDTSTRNIYLDGNAREQLNHFKDRSYRFFNPEKYASAGTDPIVSKDFDKIKAIQLALKCLNATTNTSFGLYLSEFKKRCKALNKDLN